MALTKGTSVVVKANAGYVNEGAKATVARDQVEGSIWVNVEWDEPKGDRVNGDYLASSFDVAEPVKVELTEAIAALVDKTYEEAYAAGKAAGEKSAKVISEDEKAALRQEFRTLNEKSQAVLNRLQRNGIV